MDIIWLCQSSCTNVVFHILREEGVVRKVFIQDPLALDSALMDPMWKNYHKLSFNFDKFPLSYNSKILSNLWSSIRELTLWAPSRWTPALFGL